MASVLVPAALMPTVLPACLGSSNNSSSDGGGSGGGNGTSSGSGSGGSGSGSSSGTSSGGSGGEGGSGGTAAGSFTLDDMSGPETNTLGYWYTYDERTQPNSEPPVVLMTDAGAPPGTITPAEGDQFLPQTDMNGPMGGMLPYRECKGGGE